MRPAPKEAGFTLMELLIVIAIIGLLAAIGVPSMFRMQARSRQAEAKVNLRGYFSAARSYYAETSRFDCGFCDWAPESEHRYNYFMSVTFALRDGTEGCDAGAGDLTDAGQTNTNPAIGYFGGFTAGAAGNIDGDVACDGWNINDSNDLWNPKDDVTGN